MLPSEVHVLWLAPDKYVAVNRDAEWQGDFVEVRRGSEAEVARWLALHSYIGVWAMRDYDGVLGVYARKERVACR